MIGAEGGALRIGILTDDFYPHSGGVTRSIEQQINHLVALGHQVTLFAPRYDLVPPANCASAPVAHWRIPGTASFLCSLAISGRLARRLVAEHELDVLHSQNERGSIHLAALMARAAGIPHVHTFHSNYVGTHRTTPLAAGLNSLTYLPVSGRLLAALARRDSRVPLRLPPSASAGEDSIHARRDWLALARLAREVDAFTSPASYLVDCVLDAAPELAERAHVIPSGVDGTFPRTTRRRPRDGTVRFVSCSRLSPEKRVDAILRAFVLLDRPDTELVVIGAGPSEGMLRRLAAGVPHGRVHFLGHIDNTADVAQQLADADVFILASYHFDTQGMVLAEATAAGAAVLYCDERLTVGVSPQNAHLVGPSDAELAAGMAALADDPERRATMSAASRELGSRLSPEVMARAYVAAYRDAIRRNSARGRGRTPRRGGGSTG